MRFVVSVGMVVAVTLALAAHASAAGWAIQPTPNPPGWPQAFLNGVSCPSGNACLAAGNTFFPSSTFDAFSERWNGAGWNITFGQRLGGNPNTVFNGISCRSASSCIAVGYLQNGGPREPIAEQWNGSSWTEQAPPIPAHAAQGVLNGVSCVSATNCEAVGSYAFLSGPSLPLIDRWNGSTWSVQAASPPSGSFGTFLNGVSCTSSSACLAVGYTIFGGLADTFAERWDGTAWSFEFPANRGSFNVLDGVSCTSASSCMAVGEYVDPITHDQMTLADFSPAPARWTPQTTPSPGRTFSVLHGVSCTTNGGCLAVGSYDTFRGVQVPLVDSWDGANWSFVSLPTPLGATSSDLAAVSCSALAACTTVGRYQNSAASILTLAERFTGGGSPHALTLTPRGKLLVRLHKPRTLELLVFEHGRRDSLLGAVLLGHHRAGDSVIDWNLRVARHPLRAGRYSAELVAVFAGGATSSGPSVTFDVTSHGTIHVLAASCSVAEAAAGRC
jgi:hypothetical protein